jgi:hypothetical protein
MQVNDVSKLIMDRFTTSTKRMAGKMQPYTLYSGISNSKFVLYNEIDQIITWIVIILMCSLLHVRESTFSELLNKFLEIWYLSERFLGIPRAHVKKSCKWYCFEVLRVRMYLLVVRCTS